MCVWGGGEQGGQPRLREPPTPRLQLRGATYLVHPDLPFLENPKIQICTLIAPILKSGFSQVCNKHSERVSRAQPAPPAARPRCGTLPAQEVPSAP